MASREYDVVLWGATGFTGRLVAEYLARNVPQGLRWALAGRDRDRLERLRASLEASAELRLADAGDRTSLAKLVDGARVIASTVGPYADHGTPLVEACVERGVSYCDITGEVPWIRDNIDRLHDRAVRSGARIVHCCGFDSIPSDLGVWMLHDHLARRHGRRLSRASMLVDKLRGGFSGGTVASLLGVLERASRDRALRRLLVDPHALVPDAARDAADRRDPRGARFDPESGRWTAPFVMAVINTRVVRRSNALLGYPYGRDFRYHEAVATGGPVAARLASLSLTAFTLAALTTPTRWLLRRFLPRPGEGPDERQRRSGFFQMSLRGSSDGSPALAVSAEVRGHGDPGYAETSKMLGESALCLALDDLAPDGGILTPAAAMGGRLLERLRAAGMQFGPVEDLAAATPPDAAGR